MDEFLKLFEGIISTAKQNSPVKAKSMNRWKFCVALAKIGWKAEKYEKIDGTNDIIIKWSKKGKSDINIKLSFIEQCLWIEYLDTKGRENG